MPPDPGLGDDEDIALLSEFDDIMNNDDDDEMDIPLFDTEPEI
jgi:hypothetical protein